MKIIGNGDIAKALKSIDNKKLLFFASGVSNSQEKRESEYERELNLLLEQPKSKHIVYFSSLAVFYSKTRYTKHKLQMEATVRAYFNHYTIVRLGNITWGKNPNTIINFIKNKLRRGEPFKPKHVYRYPISKSEFTHWMRMIPSWNCEMNLTGRKLLVKDIMKEYGYPILHLKKV